MSLHLEPTGPIPDETVRVAHASFSTHVLGSLRLLSRLECVAETLRQALNSLAAAAAEWLRAWIPADWFDRYGRRSEEYRLLKEKESRTQYANAVGRDGAKRGMS